MIGTIKTLRPDRGFGFIAAEGLEYFFHSSAVALNFHDLEEGDLVKFEVETGTLASLKGPRAMRVERVMAGGVA